uniref:Uncharacterized protein n=1 Tax=Tanacetum cinerariifolium TaxID=118510 RepID=A0A6L2KM23_TANCI|nr:hypothetical protein [Tanacetum cinerariifolium]
MTAFRVLKTQFHKFIKSRSSLDDDDGLMTRKYFLEYTRTEVQQFRDTLIQYMKSVKKSIDERALHKREYDSRDTRSMSGNDINADDAYIKPIYDEEPMAKSWKVYSILLFDEYLNGENQVVSKSFPVTTANASDKRQQQPDSTSSTSTLATTISADGNFDFEDENPSNVIIKQHCVLSALRRYGNEKKQTYICVIGSYALSWKPCQGDSSKLNLPDYRYKRRCCNLIPTESDSLPHAHAQATKTFYKHQDSRIKKAQELKTKTSATLIIKIFLKAIKIIKTKIVKGNC